MNIEFKNDRFVKPLDDLKYGELFCAEDDPEELWVKVDTFGAFKDDIKLEDDEIMCVHIGHGDITTY